MQEKIYRRNHFRGNFKSPAKFDWKKIVDEMKMVVLCVATLWVTTKNAPFSDRNKSFQTFLKTFEIASKEQDFVILFLFFR